MLRRSTAPPPPAAPAMMATVAESLSWSPGVVGGGGDGEADGGGDGEADGGGGEGEADGGGGHGASRGPQSAQSAPYSHRPSLLPSPPSSQYPSSKKMSSKPSAHVFVQSIGTVGGGAGGTGGDGGGGR